MGGAYLRRKSRVKYVILRSGSTMQVSCRVRRFMTTCALAYASRKTECFPGESVYCIVYAPVRTEGRIFAVCMHLVGRLS